MERIRRLDTFRICDNDGMAGIISPRTSCTYVCVRSENVDELAFSLVAPLGSEDDGDCIQWGLVFRSFVIAILTRYKYVNDTHRS